MLKDISLGLKIALVIILILFLYIFAVTFIPVGAVGESQANTIVPFFLGIMSTLIGFYWGNSSTSKKHEPPALEDEKK